MSVKNVLIVDDSEAEQFLYKHLFEAYNPETTVLKAFDGQQALEILEDLDETPDYILLDINMHRMNGLQFLENYTKSYNGNHIDVIILTSSTQSNDQKRAMEYDCVKDYWTKPIKIENLHKLEELRDP